MNAMKDFGIDIKAMLIRQGWKVEDSLENVRLRDALEELRKDLNSSMEDRDEIARRFILLHQHQDVLKCKVQIHEQQNKQKEESLKLKTEELDSLTQEVQHWKESYLREKEEASSLRKQLQGLVLQSPSSSSYVHDHHHHHQKMCDQLKPYRNIDRIIVHRQASLTSNKDKPCILGDELKPFARSKSEQPMSRSHLPAVRPPSRCSSVIISPKRGAFMADENLTRPLSQDGSRNDLRSSLLRHRALLSSSFKGDEILQLVDQEIPCAKRIA